MKVKVIADTDICITAIAYALGYENKVTSRKSVREAIRDYMQNYGYSCGMDHYVETGEHRKEAERIFNKYFQKP